MSLLPKPSTRFALVTEHAGSFQLHSGINQIGRTPACDVILSDRTVSLRHAVVEAYEEFVVVTDLASKNGSYVNGLRANKSIAKVRDVIRFGRTELELAQHAPGDEWLAVRSETGNFADSVSGTSVTSAATLSSVATQQPRRLLSLVNQLLELAVTGRPRQALALLVRELPTGSAMIVEFSPNGSIVAKHDLIREHDNFSNRTVEWVGRLVAKSPELRNTVFSRELGDEQSISVATHSLENGIIALVVAGIRNTHQIKPWLLRIGLQLLSLSVSEAPSPTTHRTQEGSSALVLPDDYLECSSPAMTGLYSQLSAAAKSNLPVLIAGETGVGKEPVAEILHRSSARSGRPFVAINCAAIPTDLLEAELFGVARGTATGVLERIGKFQEADGGSLLLDEVGDMPTTLQVKLLRVLEEHKVHPVGGVPKPLDVRILAATNRDLALRVTSELFRSDLYYRLAGFVLEVPSLKERREDIPPLVQHFFRCACREAGKNIPGVSYSALQRLIDGIWPGNVRELRHAVYRAVYYCQAGQVLDSHVLRRLAIPASSETNVSFLDKKESLPNLNLRELERLAVCEALRRAQFNKTRAAELLGISRAALQRRMAKHHLLG